MKAFILALTMVACSGCTMAALRRETLTQVNSAVDLRLREVMDNLALLSDDYTALPFYASIFTGTSLILDSGSFGETGIWARAKGLDGFFSQAATSQASRQIGQNWTVDPMVDPERLEAAQYACWWVIHGPERIDSRGISLLARPDQVPCAPGRHFGVLDRMNRIPKGWLCKGGLKDVPLKAAYQAHHGKTWVWVMPDGVRGLTELSLAIQDIARININSTTLFNPSMVPAQWQFNSPGGSCCGTAQVTVAVDCQGKLVSDTAYYRARSDSLGNDPTFRSQIVAAGATK